jgi:hypothetical protein
MELEEKRGSGLFLPLMAAAFVVFIALGLVYLSHERAQVKELAGTNQALNASLAQMKAQFQSQIDGLTEQLREKAAATRIESAPPSASNGTRAQIRTQPRRAATPAVDPRIAQLQSKLADQQKELSSTREDLNQTRQDLQGRLDSTRDQLTGSLSSTRDELNGSIAHSHDEIVALQRRGERNYYEFQITRSKDFHRVGPVSLSVRKVNTKRKNYDLAMFVNDNQMQKKSVNLFETVWINLEDRPQPVELVVNQISKDQIQGYVSEPKYKRSELGDTASVAPASPPAPGLKPAQ